MAVLLPAGGVPQHMGGIRLATDGSQAAAAAAERAIELAKERGTALSILYVVDRRVHDEPSLSSLELSTIAAEDIGGTAVQEITEACRRADVEADGTVVHGTPVETILDSANSADIDTIVIGRHGDHDHHLGGVGRRVKNRSDHEVLVIG